MNTLTHKESLAKKVSFSKTTFNVELDDGRIISIPYTWYPRLMNATKTKLNNYRLIGGGEGICWDDLDEDISVEGLLKGEHDGTAFARRYWEQHPEHRPKHHSKNSAA